MGNRKEILIKLESIFWSFLSGIQEDRLQHLTEDTIIQDLVDKYWLDSVVRKRWWKKFSLNMTAYCIMLKEGMFNTYYM